MSCARQDWGDRLHETAQFLKTYGTLPRQRGSHPNEHSLALWLRYQRIRAQSGTLLPDRQHALDHAIPNWQTRQTRHVASHDEWNRKARRVQAWLQQHGRLPRRPTGAVSGPERDLGNWLIYQRLRANQGQLDPAREDWLNKHLGPRWNPGQRAPGVSDEWLNRAMMVVNWREHHHQNMPSRRATCPTERSCANWLRTQRINLQRGRLHPDRIQWLERFLPDTIANETARA